jgi:uncharacterized protein
VLNLTHRAGHEQPALLAIGERYRVRIQLNDMGSVFPPGHKVRLAISTDYWPMIWPSPETATLLLIFAGTLDLPQRSPNDADARLSPFPEPETASPEKPTIFRRDGERQGLCGDVFGIFGSRRGDDTNRRILQPRCYGRTHTGTLF